MLTVFKTLRVVFYHHFATRVIIIFMLSSIKVDCFQDFEGKRVL